MSGSPEGSPIASMAILAVLALAATVIAIINARVVTGIGEGVARALDLAELMQRITPAVQQFTERTRKASIITQSQRQHTHRAEDKDAVSPKADLSESTRLQESRRVVKKSFWAFWLAYLLIEVPVKIIFLAYRVLAGDGDASIDPAGRSIRRAKSHGGNNILRVLGGLLILPIFLISLPF